jgi:hypothetical protein
VKIATFSKYSHCELVIDGICWSSSPRDKGVRSSWIDLQDGKWDLVQLPACYSKEKALQWFKQHEGLKYDLLGAIRSAAPVGRNQKDKWFCSEACAAALGITNPHRYTPAGLFELFR